MTPLQAAKAHCANYQPDHTCLGIAFRRDLSIYRFRKEGLPCVFLQEGCEACLHFEETVLPQVSASVAEEYRKVLPADAKTTVRPQRSIKLCPDCNKRELEPRRTYCATCAKIRKRNSKRQHMRKKRGLDVEKQAVQVPQRQGADSPKTTIRYPNPKTSILDSSFSTRQGMVENVSEAGESPNVTEGGAT